jgi:hypothetical protein
VLAVLFVPLFFVAVRRVFKGQTTQLPGAPVKTPNHLENN